MIVAYIAATFIVLGFAGILSWLGLVGIAAEVSRLSQKSLAVLRDTLLSDDAKEAAMRANARALFARFLRLTSGFAIALAIPIALVWGVAQTGILEFEAVIQASLTWPFLLGGLIVFIAVVVLDKRK
jgi:hypothetical protein